MTKVLVWHPIRTPILLKDKSSSQIRGNSGSSFEAGSEEPGKLVPSLAFLPHWSQSHSFVSGSQQQSISCPQPNSLPSAQASTLTRRSFSRLAGTKREAGQEAMKLLDKLVILVRKERKQEKGAVFISHGSG